MGKQYILDNIDKLRKQKEDGVIGGYRDLVVKTYKYINKQIKYSTTNYCNPKNADISNVVFGNRNQESRIRGFIKDLKQSGYLTVYGIGTEREVKITKDIDF